MTSTHLQKNYCKNVTRIKYDNDTLFCVCETHSQFVFFVIFATECIVSDVYSHAEMQQKPNVYIASAVRSRASERRRGERIVAQQHVIAVWGNLRI